VTDVRWYTIAPADAVDIVLPREGITGPVNEEGEPCPWPWGPQQLGGLPLGQYHCEYCGAMVLAGIPHIDYSDFDFDSYDFGVDGWSADRCIAEGEAPRGGPTITEADHPPERM
jgi:hypothetical protein